MTILFNGLRTGFTPSVKVFDFRQPNDVIATVILNLLATTVVSPNDIDELIIIKNPELELDVEYIKSAIDLEKSAEVIVKNEMSLTDFLTNYSNKNTLLTVINKFDNGILDQDAFIPLQNEFAFVEKVGIEISAGNIQRYWFEDYTMSNQESVFSSNVVMTLFFSKSDYISESNREVFNLIMHEDLEKGDLDFSKLERVLQLEFESVLEADYLDYQNFLALETAFSKLKINKKIEEPNSIHYGNSPHLNGIRALLSLYHKLATTQISSGLVFVEEKKSWKVIQVQKRGE
ncbi:hypothetical protein NYE67_15880 [Solibacillus sp. FSL W8-0474]|uniref:hypothetical protein n=1 Tax=Solibacillus sp. FSL W8-0474 TaxID=2975336 RepID=UPI0030F742DF